MMHITKVSIQGLHDVFNYDLQFTDRRGLAILYGENGAGKTTILTLIYNLLSATPKSGHLTAICRVPFTKLSVTLADRSIVSATRSARPDGYPVTFAVARLGRAPVEYRFAPATVKDRLMQEAIENEMSRVQVLPGLESVSERKRPRTSSSPTYRRLREVVLPNSDEAAHDNYFAELLELGVAAYFMGTDRRVYGDGIESWNTDRAIREMNVREESEVISTARAAYLKDALVRGARYLSRQIIRASNVGSRNADGIYADIVSRLVEFPRDLEEGDVGHRAAALVENLAGIQRRNESFTVFGLTPELNVGPIFNSIQKAGPDNIGLVERVIQPYIATLEARLNALDPLLKTIETFVNSLNEYFRFKRIKYSPSHGFQITGISGKPLDVQQLSSGEQQLLLIFCSLLAATENNCIFIIDEPEISLNVKWQRELIASLLAIMSNSNSQLLIATHSIELLTQHSEAIVPLNPQIIPERDYVHERPSKDD